MQNLILGSMLSEYITSNTDCLCSAKLARAKLDSLPRFDILATVSNVPHLSDLDPDLQIPSQTNFKYYSTHDFHSNYGIRNCSIDTSFSALNCNIRSLQANFDNFCCMLTDLSLMFSVIGLSETKIKDNQDPLLNTEIPGYIFISQPTLSNAGGVGFYIRNDLSYIIRNDFSTYNPDFQSLWIEIQSKTNSNMICGVIYRHPNIFKFETFKNYLDPILDKISKEKKYCIMMGDFNINLLNFESHLPTDDFINTLGSYFFLPQILQPTRVTDHSATLIDNIFFNSLEHYSVSGNIVHDLTDHFPNFLIINKFSHLPSKTKIYKRDYSHFNDSALVDEIRFIDWSTVLSDSYDVNTLFNSFYLKLSNIVDKHVPLKMLQKKEIKFMSKPWITPAIKVSIDRKNKLYKKYLKTRSPYLHSKFKLYRNKLNHLLRISKRMCYNDFFNNNINNMKNTWKGIRQLINLNPKSFHAPTKIIKDNIELVDGKSIADDFNDFFANIGSKLANSIPPASKSPLSSLPPQKPNSFYLLPVTSNDIEQVISTLDIRKACGPFSIPTKLLKLLKCFLSKPLETIFNVSFTTGMVPDDFKVAKGIPIYKKGLNTSLGNYRPISLFSIFNLILEKLIFKRLMNFIETQNILYSQQFGFRQKYSTTQALLSITNIRYKKLLMKAPTLVGYS